MKSATHPSVQQFHLSRSLGHLQQLEETPQGVKGYTDFGHFQVTFYTAKIARIHISLHEIFENPSYATVGKPQQVNWELQEHRNFINLTTQSMRVEIKKAPVRFTFFNPDGREINGDDPAFGTSWIGEQVTTYKKLRAEERFIGLGEKTGPLDRRGKGYTNWNTDSYAYDDQTDPIYSSIPFYIGIHDRGIYGIFLDNSHKSFFNFGASNQRFSSFGADQGDMDYYYMAGGSVASIIESYTFLTGRMPLPPLWALGYQQCRYSYYPEEEVLSLAQTFRNKQIPADVVVLDIHYMDHYKIFTWDNDRFPDPAAMIKKLRSSGFRVVLMCDPGIKIEKGYAPYDSGLEADIFIKYPDGENYSGEVWPGWCHFPDFTSPKARSWWMENLKSYTEIGVEGFWNDMNEIATWGNTLPELIEMDFDGPKATARKGRNIYGLMMAKSTYEGAKKHLGNKRPFNLTRSAFAGVQRYATLWTGDNVANDEHMLLGVRLLNSLGISGVPFVGYDVGGFSGNSNKNLFARWVELGAFSPFFRGHTMVNNHDAEPWAYGEEVEEISRNYMQLRYNLLPYLYAVFYEASSTGMPVARSLAIDFTHDPKVFAQKYQNEFLFGPGILVAPVESHKDLEKVYLPAGEWYDFFTDQVWPGGQELIVECPIEKLPLFVRGSAILLLQSPISSTNEAPAEYLEVHIYQGDEPSSFVYYEDDGVTDNHRQGQYFKREIRFLPRENTLRINHKEGEMPSKFLKIKLMLHGFGNLRQLLINGRPSKLSTCEYRFVAPISKFDPLGAAKGEALKIPALHFTEFDHEDQSIEITWQSDGDLAAS